MPKTHQPRKKPRQSRSQQTRRDLLEGATRVLEEAGAGGFNTNRVAEVTGVSVGSLYQYYPNKGALLADLHTTHVEASFSRLAQVLEDTSRSPRERLLDVVLSAFAAQAAGMEHHAALRSAGVPCTEFAPAPNVVAAVERALSQFLSRALPERANEAAELAAFCTETVLGLLARMASHPNRDWSAIAERTAASLVEHVGV